MAAINETDRAFLDQALAIKRARPAPRQSNFKVVSIITYSYINDNGGSGSGKEEIGYVIGGNVEPSFIGGTICAERCAVSQLSVRPFTRLLNIYLVSDSPTALEPGLLCREFLAEFLQPNQDIPIFMTSENAPVVVSSLRTLYPFIHLYIGVPRANLLTVATEFSRTCEQPKKRFSKDVVRLYESVLEATKRDTDDFLHPLKYAAGVLLKSGEILVWHLNKLMEYGHSLDPISFLVHHLLYLQQSKEALYILQCDQFGVIHSPCAPARCQLLEHRSSFPSLEIIFHSETGRLENVPITSLAVGYADVTAGLNSTNACANTGITSTPKSKL